MLTNAENLFSTGAEWPPPCEDARLKDVADFYTLHSGAFGAPGNLKGERATGIFQAAFERIVRDDYSAHFIALNLFRVAVQTPADLLFGEDSELRGSKDGENDALHEWAERERMWAQAYECMIDAEIAGDGYFRIVPDGGQARLSVVSPDICFPIVAPDDVRKELGFVVAWKWNAGTKDQPRWVGIAERHDPGYYQRLDLTFDRDGKKITGAAEGVRIPTGAKGLSIVHLVSPNRRTNAYHGTSDIADIDSLVAEIMVRLEQASRVMDKHSDPSINAPEGAFEINPATGKYELKAGRAFILGEGDTPADYMTWDGQLGPNFVMHESLMAHFYQLTQLSPALFDGRAGAATSGAALKRMMIPTLAKVGRWRQSVETALRQVAQTAAEIERLNVESLHFTWSDGLPDDPTETAAELANLRAAGVISRGAAVARLTGESGKPLNDEIAAIEAEDNGTLVPEPA